MAIALAALLTFGHAIPAHAQPPGFAGSGPLSSNTGHLLVEWKADTPVTLEISGDPSFSDADVLYRGANDAFFLSGLAGGDYFLRLTDEDGERSAAATLTVEHQSLNQALWLTLVGAIITLGILATIVRGARP